MSTDRIPEPQLQAAPDPDRRQAFAPPTVPDVPAEEEQVGILLVDDHRENLAALKAVLEPLGERLVTAESGEQALRALLREDIAVILLDVRMAGLDGLQTARIIRARPRTRHIPIIFLTAQVSEVEEIAMAYASGAVDYVIKPFEPEILRAKVSVFVELSRERGERVRQSRARAEAEAVARTVRTLQILSDAALSHLEMHGLTSELVERTATLFQADAACLLLRDENAPGLGVHATRGRLPVPVEGRVMLGEGTFGRLALERRPRMLVGDEVPGGAGRRCRLGGGRGDDRQRHGGAARRLRRAAGAAGARRRRRGPLRCRRSGAPHARRRPHGDRHRPRPALRPRPAAGGDAPAQPAARPAAPSSAPRARRALPAQRPGAADRRATGTTRWSSTGTAPR